MKPPPALSVIACPVDVARNAGARSAQLDAEERARARRLLRAEDRARFVAAHWLKRAVLVRLTGDPALRLRTSPSGKPGLPDGPEFNLSHGGGWVALAWGDRPVGVDVEPGRAAEVWRDVLPHIRGTGDAVDDPLRLWTAKEAALKCRGTGFLSDPRDLPIRAAGAGFRAGTDLVGQWRAADTHHCLAVASAAPKQAIAWQIARTPQALLLTLAGLVAAREGLSPRLAPAPQGSP